MLSGEEKVAEFFWVGGWLSREWEWDAGLKKGEVVESLNTMLRLPLPPSPQQSFFLHSALRMLAARFILPDRNSPWGVGLPKRKDLGLLKFPIKEQ